MKISIFNLFQTQVSNTTVIFQYFRLMEIYKAIKEFWREKMINAYFESQQEVFVWENSL